MKVYKTVLENAKYRISVGVSISEEGKIRKEYTENHLLNIYSPKIGNPVVEDLMDKVILSRRVPINDGEVTLHAIKEKFPYMTNYIDGWIEALQKYKNMV